MKQQVVKARDEEIYTFIAKGGSYQAAAARWELKIGRIHAIVRGVARTTRLARQETALDEMLRGLEEVKAEALAIGTSSALQAYIRAQDQQAKLLGLYDITKTKDSSDDMFSAWDYVETEEA